MWAGITAYDTEYVEASWEAYLNLAETLGAVSNMLRRKHLSTLPLLRQDYDIGVDHVLPHQDSPTQALVAMIANEQTITHTSIVSNSLGEVDPPVLAEFLAIPNISTTVGLGTVAEVVPQFTGPTPLGLL